MWAAPHQGLWAGVVGCGVWRQPFLSLAKPPDATSSQAAHTHTHIRPASLDITQPLTATSCKKDNTLVFTTDIQYYLTPPIHSLHSILHYIPFVPDSSTCLTIVHFVPSTDTRYLPRPICPPVPKHANCPSVLWWNTTCDARTSPSTHTMDCMHHFHFHWFTITYGFTKNKALDRKINMQDFFS